MSEFVFAALGSPWYFEQLQHVLKLLVLLCMSIIHAFEQARNISMHDDILNGVGGMYSCMMVV